MAKLNSWLFLLSSFCLFSGSQLAAQSDSAAIYKIAFRMDRDLVSTVQISANHRSFLNGYSSSPTFPEDLIDSVRTYVVHMVEEVTGHDSKIVYKRNKEGEPLTTIGIGPTLGSGDLSIQLEGMPVAGRKATRKRNPSIQYFVEVNIDAYASGGVSWSFLDTRKHMRYKPKIKIEIKEYDSKGKKVFSEKLTIKDFQGMRAREITTKDGKFSVRKGDVLYPEDIYEMFLVAGGRFIEKHN